MCVGNYMNGGTPLGQADGFHLDILPKLKDILAKVRYINYDCLVEDKLNKIVDQIESTYWTKTAVQSQDNILINTPVASLNNQITIIELLLQLYC